MNRTHPMPNRKGISGRRSLPWIPAAIAALLCLATGAQDARAGREGVPLEAPMVYPEATINAVVVPYRVQGGPHRQLSLAAERLTRLAHQNFLFSILKYGRVGATALTGDPVRLERSNGSESEIVLAKLLGRTPSSGNELLKGHGVVLLSGILYEENQEFYVRTEVRYLRRDVPEEIRLELEAGGDRMELLGRLPYQSFAFAPRRLTLADLEEIDSAFSQGMQLYEAPDETAPHQALRLSAGGPLSYRVMETRRSWMKIDVVSSRQEGWVRTGQTLGEGPMATRLPELYLAEALAGYLSLRMSLDGTVESSHPEQLVAWIRRAIDLYERFSYGRQAPEAAATAQAVRGALEVLDSGDAGSEPDRFARAEEDFSRAMESTPYSAEALNLVAMVQIYRRFGLGQPDPDPAGIKRTLQRALAMDTRNQNVVRSLRVLYDLASQPDTAAAGPAEEFRRSRDTVAKISDAFSKTYEITWQPVEEAAYYQIEVAYSHSYDQVQTLQSSEPRIEVRVRPDSEFRYRIRATDPNGRQGPWSRWSGPRIFELPPPSAPSNLRLE